MWEIEFSQEATNCAINSLPYNEDVLIAIERLRSSKDGLPSEGSYQVLDNWCIWEIANHSVVYEREVTLLSIFVWVIKPS